LRLTESGVAVESVRSPKVEKHMPKPSSSNLNTNTVPSFQPPRQRPRWLSASSCFLIGLLISVAFFDFAPEQSRQTGTNFRQAEPNLVGSLGSEFTWWSLHLIGVSIWLLPPFLFWMTYLGLRSTKQFAATRVLAMIVCVITASSLAAMIESFGKTQYFTEGLGGLLGNAIYQGVFKETLGVFGTVVLLGTTYALGFIFIIVRDISAEFDKLAHGLQAWRERRAARKAEAAELRAQLKVVEEKRKAESAKLAVVAAPPPTKKLTLPRTGNTASPFAPKTADEPKPASALAPEDLPPPVPPAAPKINRGSVKTEPMLEKLPAGLGPVSIVKAEETRKAKSPAVPLVEENYQFPPLSLLNEQASAAGSGSDDEYAANMADLVRILGEFGVTVTPGEIHVGPVITCYEVAPAPGVRVEKIAGLDKNIALGMRAQSVRILAPIPGKAAVGVEIPNRVPTPVGMREILESEDWSSAKAEIPIALGKDVSGKPLISDLAKMPHLLIAGATGSGKSVCINSIIASIVYRKSPKDLRLIMVDPKVVELKIFNTLPHMLIPVVTEPKKVPAALKWLLGEMEQRYQQFAKVGVRNIAGFNSRKKASAADFPADAQPTLDGVDPLAPDDGLEIPEKLPYIVAIIDELADLMMVAPAEIETSIARLAQLARAAGIHLIIATQRPSVNVITGVIKANLPSRIAFQVASQVDSRTILDGKGADTLIGRGDMLFSPPGSSRLVRAQGAFVSDEEVHEFVEFLKKNGPPQYASSVQQQIDRDASADDDDDDAGGDEDLGDDEDLYNQALDVIKSTKRASTSMIQRRLRIGYNRAARIMDLMEQKGIVGPENGSSPREILVDVDSL
jgi:DNA segregation ATPase FtsK/SpoIIIE, S-DNA-T family